MRFSASRSSAAEKPSSIGSGSNSNRRCRSPLSRSGALREDVDDDATFWIARSCSDNSLRKSSKLTINGPDDLRGTCVRMSEVNRGFMSGMKAPRKRLWIRGRMVLSARYMRDKLEKPSTVRSNIPVTREWWILSTLRLEEKTGRKISAAPTVPTRFDVMGQ